MEITGSQKVNAPRQLVFESLLNPEILKNSILESVQAFSRGASQADDITLLIARYRGATNASNANPSSEASLSAYQ